MDLNEFEINDYDLLNDIEDIDIDENDINSRYIKPKQQKNLKTSQVRYLNAEQLVKKINLKEKNDVFSIVDGTFIFGDFILALLRYHDIKAKRLDISTLSLSLNNIAGIKVFMDKGYIDNINFLIGYYFYAHERKGLIKEMYNQLDVNNKMQLAVCRNHTKITTILTDRGQKITIHGSANLRSSNNLEQLHLTFNEDIYNFVNEFNDKVIQEYKTIKKPLTNNQIIKL